MSVLQELCQRNSGFRMKTTYDFVLKRLKCYDSGDCRANIPVYPPTFACRFCTVKNHQHLIALANEDGKVTIQDVNVKDKSILAEGTQAHHNAIFDLAWMEDEFKLVSVSGDHTAVLWDVTNCELKELDKFESHTRSVKTVAFKPKDKAIFATGGRDGMIMIWDTRSKQGLCRYKPDNVIANSHTPGLPSGSKYKKNKCPSSRANSVTGLIFQDENTLISCGAGDGMIKIWDLRKHYSAYKRDPIPRAVLQYAGSTSKNGFTNLLLDPTRVKLYASCMDNTIYCYNVATYDKEPVATYVGHETGSFYVRTCLSPDGNYLVSGSSDEKAYIWNVNKRGQPLATLVGHFLEVTCVAWCPEGEIKIVTCSDDTHVRYWEVGNEYDEYSDLEIRGWAEEYSQPVLSVKSKLNESIMGTLNPSISPLSKLIASLETTPRAQKRSALYPHKTPETSDSIVKPYTCQNCEGSGETVTPCMKCVDMRETQLHSFRRNRENHRQSVDSCGGSQSLKRRLEDLMEEEVSSIGRVHSVLSPISELNVSSAKRFHFDNKGARRLFDLPIEEECTNECVHNAEHNSGLPTSVPASPTINLPNYVVDGTSPHHCCVRKSLQKENVDWLTKLKKEKNCQERIPHTVHNMPKRRSRSGSSSDGTILKFFRVSGKSVVDQPVFPNISLPSESVKSDA